MSTSAKPQHEPALQGSASGDSRYRGTLERIIAPKASQPFDPSAWLTDLFASDEELDNFLDDIYASRRADRAS